jgi:Beta-lactamase enzyme family
VLPVNRCRRATLAACLSVLTPVLPATPQLDRAASWAADRKGDVAWAVIDTRGTVHHRRGTKPFASASTSKAMLLAAYLRQTGDRPLDPAAEKLLTPMIVRSSNRAAHRVRPLVGDAGLAAVARAAGMRRFHPNGTWSEVQITAVDQARFFLRIDRLIPRRHRAYARRLLSTIVPSQSWGIPRAARPHGARVLFKGGWRKKLVHQAALVETADGERLSIAVLSDTNPTHEYGRGTIEGITRRLIAPIPRP